MSKHFCQGLIRKHGQKFWGSPSDRPLSDPIPPELLAMHPDVITDWMNCDNCGEAMCGKPANFKLGGCDGDDDVWLCADHYDEFKTQRTADGFHFPNYHDRCDF